MGGEEVVDRDIIISKMSSIRHHLDRLKNISRMKGHVFLDSDDAQDICIFNLQMAIQKCIDIGNHFYSEWDIGAPASYGEVFEALKKRKVITKPTMDKLMKMVGLRNRIVREYKELDIGKIHSFVRNNLRDFDNFLKQVIKHV